MSEVIRKSRLVKLLPCPFCGSKAHIVTIPEYPGMYYAECANYGDCIAGPRAFGGLTPAEAAEGWNARMGFAGEWFDIRGGVPAKEGFYFTYWDIDEDTPEGMKELSSMHIMYWSGKRWSIFKGFDDDDCDYSMITHWMRLPEPPSHAYQSEVEADT